MDTETTQQSTIVPENDRVYYTYGDLEIDLKHYLHNLNTNLNRFLDSRKHWSEGQKLVFRDRFEILKQGLQELLDSNTPRFNTGSNGVLNDLQGELQNNIVYLDAQGNVYSPEEAANIKGIQEFNVSDALNRYTSRVGGSIAVRGLNKPYYEKLALAKLQLLERLAKLAASISEQKANQNEVPTFDINTLGFLLHIKQNSTIYNGLNDSFDWQKIYDIDNNPNDFTNRLAGLRALLESYYNSASNATVDFSTSDFENKENYLKALKTAYDSLSDGYLESDNEAFNKIGIDSQFLGNWFSSVSPKEREITEAAAQKKLEVEQKLDGAIPLISAGSPLEGNVLPLLDILAYRLVEGNDNMNIAKLAQQFCDNLGINTDQYNKSPKDFDTLLYNTRSEIANNLMLGNIDTATINKIQNLLALDAATEKYGLTTNFIKGNDGLYYLNYLNYKKGVVVVYNPSNKSIYLQPTSKSKETPIYLLLLEEAANPEKDQIYSAKLGGKLLAGGTFGQALETSLTNLRGNNPKTLSHANATSGLSWNGSNSILSDENFNMEYEDYARIATLAANIGSVFADPIVGAGIGVTASVGDFTADLADESLSVWDAAKNLAANLGLDVVALIPGGESLKIVKGIKTISGTLAKGLAAYGVLNTISNGEEILNSIKNVASGNYSRQDFLNASQGVLLLASAIKGGKSLASNKSNKKVAANLVGDEAEIGVRINEGGKERDVKIKGKAANDLREAYKNNNEKAANSILLEYFGGDTGITIAKRTDTTTPLKTQWIWKDGKPRSPIAIDKKLDVFETYSKSNSKASKLLRRQPEIEPKRNPLEAAPETPTEQTQPLIPPVQTETPEIILTTPVREEVVTPTPTIEPEISVTPKIETTPKEIKTLLEAGEYIKKWAKSEIESIDPKSRTLQSDTDKKKSEIYKKLKEIKEDPRKFVSFLNWITGNENVIIGDEVLSSLRLAIRTIINNLGIIPNPNSKKKRKHEEGGILFMEGGGSANPYDAVTWNYNTRYRNVYKDGKWVLEDRDKNGNIKGNNTGRYIAESGNNVQVGELENTYSLFYNNLSTDEELAKNWAEKYRELNSDEVGDANQKDWWDKDGNFNFEGFKKSVAVSGKKLWADLTNGIGHDVYKGNTYYTVGDDGKTKTYYSKPLDGYTTENTGTENGLLTEYKLVKNAAKPVPPTEPEDELEYPSFEEVNGILGANPQKQYKSLNTSIQGLMDKVPSIAEYLRLNWLNRSADKLTEMALKGETPFLLDPYEVHRAVFGNLRAKQDGEKAAADLRRMASKPMTSDASLLMAAQMEAQVKGQQYIDAGNKADDAMMQETAEKAWLLEKDNAYNRWKVAMENRRNMLATIANKAKIKHAGESVKTNNTNTYWMNEIKNFKDKMEERKELTEAADLKDLARVASTNPEALGIDLSQGERDALNAIVSGQMTYSLLPENYKQFYLNARQKLSWAESNYVRKQKHLPESPFAQAIEDGFNDNWNLYEESPAFKDGGKVTVAKIKEKIKNADRHLKTIQKQIDSLDKKLDRLSKGMYSMGKVTQLR